MCPMGMLLDNKSQVIENHKELKLFDLTWSTRKFIVKLLSTIDQIKFFSKATEICYMAKVITSVSSVPDKD